MKIVQEDKLTLFLIDRMRLSTAVHHVIDKKYAAIIINREKTYCKITKTNKQVFHSMIVSGGLKKTMYSEEIISFIATLSDLFKS